MRTLYLVFGFLFGFVVLAWCADEVDLAKTLIRSQIAAISRDDAEAAYGLASPGIQRVFRKSDVFLNMVKDRYPPIYHHRAFSFGDAREENGQVALEVLIIDADGVPWKGLYTVERETDGSMKISGCVLVQVAGQPV